MFRRIAVAAVIGLIFAYHANGKEPEGSSGSEGNALKWTIWVALGEAAKSCKSEADARNFFDTVGMVVSVPEKAEVFSDVVETLAIEKPLCFLSAAASMEPRNLRLMVDHFLAHPKQHSTKDIEVSLANYWNQAQYSKIRNIYFESNK